MAQISHYSHAETPAGPGFDTIIPDVAVLPGHKLTAAASVGDASIVKVTVDDPTLAYEFVGLNRWYVTEDLIAGGGAGSLIWNGYIADQGVGRAGDAVMFPFGRSWGLDLVETSTIIGFRIITDTDGDRPAETAAERLTWLLFASDYLMTVGDNGLIDWDGLEDFDMDENDYRGQTPRDVISDIAVRSQFNYWAYYDPDADEDLRINLALFHPDSELYTSDVRITNEPADVGGDTYAAHMDAELVRRPDRIAAGGYLPYSGGAVYDYNYDTADEFAFRDRAFPMASVKTEALAEDLLADLLATFDEQDDRITDQILVPAANINDLKHGHRIQVKYVHFPGYEDWRWVRVVRKTFAPPANQSQDVYEVNVEMVPIVGPPGDPSGAFSRQKPGSAGSGVPVLPAPTTPGNVLLALAIIGGNVTQFPDDVRFLDNPGAVPVPPYPDHDGWTVLDLAVTDYSGMPESASCAPFTFNPVPYCHAGLVMGWAWRYVAPGEVTTTPVAVSGTNGSNNAVIYVWEIPTTTAPVLVETVGSRHGVNPDHWAFGTSAGNLVGAFAFMQSDFNLPPVAVTADGGVTEVQSNTANNNSLGGPGFPPYIWVGQRPLGGVVGVTFEAIPVYGHVNGAGMMIELPEGFDLPPIPWPANQT